MVETHKVAALLVEDEKTKKPTIDKFVVASKDGWVDASGKPVNVSSSPKKTKFFSNEADAKANGFSPSDVQKAALASWVKPVVAPEVKK